MNLGKTLIDKAAANCSSYNELAAKLGTSKQALSSMKQGKREISPETAVLLADIAKENAIQAMVDAVIERNKTGQKAEKIRAILGKVLAVGGAAMLVFFYGGITNGTTEAGATELTRYTSYKVESRSSPGAETVRHGLAAALRSARSSVRADSRIGCRFSSTAEGSAQVSKRLSSQGCRVSNGSTA